MLTNMKYTAIFFGIALIIIVGIYVIRSAGGAKQITNYPSVAK